VVVVEEEEGDVRVDDEEEQEVVEDRVDIEQILLIRIMSPSSKMRIPWHNRPTMHLLRLLPPWATMTTPTTTSFLLPPTVDIPYETGIIIMISRREIRNIFHRRRKRVFPMRQRRWNPWGVTGKPPQHRLMDAGVVDEEEVHGINNDNDRAILLRMIMIITMKNNNTIMFLLLPEQQQQVAVEVGEEEEEEDENRGVVEEEAEEDGTCKITKKKKSRIRMMPSRRDPLWRHCFQRQPPLLLPTTTLWDCPYLHPPQRQHRKQQFLPPKLFLHCATMNLCSWRREAKRRIHPLIIPTTTITRMIPS
jgi:hypothetical protein